MSLHPTAAARAYAAGCGATAWTCRACRTGSWPVVVLSSGGSGRTGQDQTMIPSPIVKPQKKDRVTRRPPEKSAT